MAIPAYMWLKDDGGADIKGPVTVQGRGGILTKAVRQRPNSVIPPSVSRERLTRMASGGAPAQIALSSRPDGNLTIDFIDRGETGVEVPVPELSVD